MSDADNTDEDQRFLSMIQEDLDELLEEIPRIHHALPIKEQMEVVANSAALVGRDNAKAKAPHGPSLFHERKEVVNVFRLVQGARQTTTEEAKNATLDLALTAIAEITAQHLKSFDRIFWPVMEREYGTKAAALLKKEWLSDGDAASLGLALLQTSKPWFLAMALPLGPGSRAGCECMHCRVRDMLSEYPTPEAAEEALDRVGGEYGRAPAAGDLFHRAIRRMVSKVQSANALDTVEDDSGEHDTISPEVNDVLSRLMKGGKK